MEQKYFTWSQNHCHSIYKQKGAEDDNALAVVSIVIISNRAEAESRRLTVHHYGMFLIVFSSNGN